MIKLWKKQLSIAAIFVASSLLLAGCGGEDQEAMPKIPVKVMKIVKADTPLSYGAPGQLRGTDEVEVHSRVSGSIVEKYFKGGDAVRAGAPLYRIDSRQYETAVLQARANLHKAESDLRNAQEDLARNEMLFKDKAVSEQTVTNKRADVAAHLATVEAQQAALKKAQESLDDTIVYAPMSGRVSVDDVAVGTYATAGTTRLVTIGSIDPVYVQFGISETEYLNILAEDIESGAEIDENKYQLPKIKVMLTNGREYPYEGQIVMVDRALSDNSGSITLKALLPNPQGILLPGMFTQVRIVGVVEKDALLVPTRAVQQLLDENFVLVVGEDGKSTSKKIKLGERVGSYYIVTSGLTESDSVIVEGLTNLRGGAELDIISVTPEEMGFSINETSEIVDKS